MDMCTDMCIDMRINMCTEMCMNVCIGVCIRVCAGVCYPISRAEDYMSPLDPRSFSKYYSPAGAKAISLENNHQSHYVVISANTFQCVDGVRNGVVPDYDELVVQDRLQLAPCYRMYFTAP